MKLLIITAVTGYLNNVKHILKKAEVKSYSYKEVNGYTNASETAMDSNWFGGNIDENESVLFYAFVPKANVDKVFDAINSFNAKQETLSHIHVAIINIEKSN